MSTPEVRPLLPWADLAWVPEPGRSCRVLVRGKLYPAPQVSSASRYRGSPVPWDVFTRGAEVISGLPIDLDRWTTLSTVLAREWWPYPFVRVVVEGVDGAPTVATNLVPRWVEPVQRGVEYSGVAWGGPVGLREYLAGLSSAELDAFAYTSDLGGPRAVAAILDAWDRARVTNLR